MKLRTTIYFLLLPFSLLRAQCDIDFTAQPLGKLDHFKQARMDNSFLYPSEGDRIRPLAEKFVRQFLADTKIFSERVGASSPEQKAALEDQRNKILYAHFASEDVMVYDRLSVSLKGGMPIRKAASVYFHELEQLKALVFSFSADQISVCDQICVQDNRYFLRISVPVAWEATSKQGKSASIPKNTFNIWLQTKKATAGTLDSVFKIVYLGEGSFCSCTNSENAQIISQADSLLQAAFLAGYAALKDSKNEEAQTLFSTVVSEKTQIPEAHYNLALAYYHTEAFDSAIYHFEVYQTLAKQGVPNDFQNTLGLAYYQKGDPEKAKLCFLKTPKLPAVQRNYQVIQTFSDLDSQEANLLQRDPRLCSIFLKWRDCGRCKENARAFKKWLRQKKRDGTYRKSEYKELKYIIRKR